MTQQQKDYKTWTKLQLRLSIALLALAAICYPFVGEKSNSPAESIRTTAPALIHSR